jgi:hypothetical protein
MWDVKCFVVCGLLLRVTLWLGLGHGGLAMTDEGGNGIITPSPLPHGITACIPQGDSSPVKGEALRELPSRTKGEG